MAFLVARLRKDPIKTRGGGRRVAPFQKTWVLHFPAQRPSLAPVMRQLENAKCRSYRGASRRSTRQRFSGSWSFPCCFSSSHSVISLSLLQSSCLLSFFFSLFLFFSFFFFPATDGFHLGLEVFLGYHTMVIRRSDGVDHDSFTCKCWIRG